MKSGTLPPDAATIDHLFSKFDARRWVKQKRGELRKVLSCNECNNLKGRLESSRIPREELIERGKGFGLNPKRKKIINQTFDTIEEVIAHFRENGIDISEKRGMFTV